MKRPLVECLESRFCLSHPGIGAAVVPTTTSTHHHHHRHHHSSGFSSPTQAPGLQPLFASTSFDVNNSPGLGLGTTGLTVLVTQPGRTSIF